MTVEIKQSDTPEEIKQKLESFWEYQRKKAKGEQEKREKEIMELCGSIKIDFDPVEWQSKLRSEWD